MPRSLLANFLAMEQSSQVGVYFLIGEATEDGNRLVYVGQTGDLRVRLSAHNQKKDFWERALVLVSKTNSLTQTHALYLESLALQQIRQADRFADENGNGGSRPHTPAPLEAECQEIFETGSILVSSLGYPLFDPVAQPKQREEPGEVFRLRSPSNGVEARGLYTAEGFVVLAGSVGRIDTAPSLGETNERWRQRLLDSGVMQPDDQARLVFPKDHLFKSPSGAAIALLGRTANGWKEWKSPQGQTLHQLVREPEATHP
ncbi:MAG: GIY-YIG nuclease family protein [Cyanobium sp. LacPavin_0920_WC12_MAG_62_9]|nr:GIY-YIG nuclease family protein [Cyanobium sp. LacPavin_0920_WC12_MAG_62_9]